MANIVIDGNFTWNTSQLRADELRFKSGSTLLFTQNAIDEGGGKLTILARSIINEDQANLGVITWETPKFIPTPDLGKAPNGASYDRFNVPDGYIGSVDGGDGGDGADGYRGEKGQEAPTLEFWVLDIMGPGPMIDFRGQRGQNGGKAQDGGDGGNGMKGKSAHGGVFTCISGGWYGGRGGNGGRGGHGGRGGNGGDGGTIMIFSQGDNLQYYNDNTRCRVTGGNGGDGGAGGTGGQYGLGGMGGNGVDPWCRDETNNRVGQNGSSFGTGGDGGPGDQGSEGPNTVLVPISIEVFNERMGL